MKAKFDRSLVLRLLAGLGLLLGFLIFCAELFAPTVLVELNSIDARHDGGLAYIAPLRKQSNLLYQFRPDGVDRTHASSLILYEDGKPLGPAHSTHEEIRRQGTGHFSHWAGALWFSSSDRSDPRSNGRSYVADGRLSVRSVWVVAGTVMFGAALLFLNSAVVLRLGSRYCRPQVPRLARLLTLSSEARHSKGSLTTVIGALGALVCAGAVIYGWYDGDTSMTGLGVARFFPVSDAFGYHSCAMSIAAAGKFDEPFGDIWCARRSLYPAMLASLFSLTAWSSQVTLIAQGFIVGLAIATLALTVSSIGGPLAALVAAVLLLYYAWEFVLGLFMTEVLGFTLGLCGLALLLGFCKTRDLWQLLAGASFISIGLAARAGALFVLPMLPIWAALSFRSSNSRQRAQYFSVALVGVISGPVLQFVVVSLLGADISNTGGNFSASLYGLSTGTRDWSQAYRDFEPLFRRNEAEAFRQIYQSAFENIKGKPEVFLGALLEAGRLYFASLFSFVAAYRSNEVLTVFAALGVVRCLFGVQHPGARLLLALAIAEILAAPLIIDSGGTRVFAVTAPLRILFCALGVQWSLQCLHRAITRVRVLNDEMVDIGPSSRLALCIGIVVLTLVVLPTTPLAYASRLRAVTGLGCPPGLKEVVARLGRESQSLTIVQANAAIESIDPFRIGPERLLKDSRLPATWFGKDLLNVLPPLSILRAVDLSSPAASAVRPLAFVGQLPDSSALQSLCVDEGSYVSIAEVRHHLIKQIRPISAP